MDHVPSLAAEEVVGTLRTDGYQVMDTAINDVGYQVLRGALTKDEVDRLAGPICAAFVNGTYDGYTQEHAYPETGRFTMGPRILDEHPEIAALSLAHPAIMEAIEGHFGEPATVAQYWSIMRTPGAGVTDKPYVNGSGVHFDYKPWRCVGSFVKWVFAIIPFVDYTESAGPLVVAPGSHLKTKVLPSNGRVHPVDAARVVRPDEVTLEDPGLKKGDVILMHGFAWHEARPNVGTTDRSGLYMKFHARSSPPACGPTIFPSAVHDALHDEVRHVVPYHRGDGRYAALRNGVVGGIDEGRILIEDANDHVLFLRDGADGWALPCFPAAGDEKGTILDACNVMGSVLDAAHAQLGLPMPWLTWLADVPGNPPNPGTDEWRCRVYGHRLSDAAPAVGQNGQAPEYRWMSAAEVDAAGSAGQLTCGGQARQWLRMWQQQEDDQGRRVTRSFGFPVPYGKNFSYNRNGNPEGHCRVGDFGADGRPTTPPMPKG